MKNELMRVYRVNRVAKMFDAPVSWVYRMVREGKLDAIQIGERTMRITQASIDKFISEHKRKRRVEREDNRNEGGRWKSND